MRPSCTMSCTSRGLWPCRRARARARREGKGGAKAAPGSSVAACSTTPNLTRPARHSPRRVVIAIVAQSVSPCSADSCAFSLGNEIRPITRPAQAPLGETGANGASSERACPGVGLIGHGTCERGGHAGYAKRKGGAGLSRYKIYTLSGCFLVRVLSEMQTCRSAPFWILSQMHKSCRCLSICM